MAAAISPPIDGVACEELLPFDLWVHVAAELGWPDRAFFAGACRGFAAAAARVGARGMRPPKGVPRHAWVKHVTSVSRASAALAAGLFDDARYSAVARAAQQLGGPAPLEAIVAAVAPPGPRLARALAMWAAKSGHGDECVWLAVGPGAGRPGGAPGVSAVHRTDSGRTSGISAVHRADSGCKFAGDLLRGAAGHGRLEVCEQIAQRFRLSAEDIRGLYHATIRAAAAGGHVEVCEWLADRAGATAEDARAHGYLKWASASGRIEVCAWVVRRFGEPGVDAVRAALAAAAQAGRADTCEWLVTRFDLGVEDLHESLAFYVATMHGRQNVFERFVDVFGLGADYIRRMHCLNQAANSGNIAFCSWMCDRFALGDADAREDSCSPSRAALGFGRRHVYVWLKAKFGLTRADLRSLANVQHVLYWAAAGRAWARRELAEFGMTADEAREIRALEVAVHNSDPAFCAWLADTLGLADVFSPAAIAATTRRTLRLAVEHREARLALRLARRFGARPADADLDAEGAAWLGRLLEEEAAKRRPRQKNS